MAHFKDNDQHNNLQNKEGNELGAKHETKTDNRVLMSELLAQCENRTSDDNHELNDDLHREQDDESCPTVSHLPTQQSATPIMIKKQGPFESIWLWLGLSDDDDDEKNKDRKLTIREAGTFISKWLNKTVFIVIL